MFPLLIRDGLRVPYFALCAIFSTVHLLYLDTLNPVIQTEKSAIDAKLLLNKGDLKSKLKIAIFLFVLVSYTGISTFSTALSGLVYAPSPDFPLNER
jgi:hypothetical protein